MSNPHRGEASLRALGRDWTLRFNSNAICEFEDVAQVPVSAIHEVTGIRFTYLRALVWAGLGHHHRRERGGLAEAGNIIDDVGPDVIAEVITKGLSSAFPPKEGDQDSPPKAAQNSEVGSIS